MVSRVVVKFSAHGLLVSRRSKSSVDTVASHGHDFSVGQIRISLSFFEVRVHVTPEECWVIRINCNLKALVNRGSDNVSPTIEEAVVDFEDIVGVRAFSQRDLLAAHACNYLWRLQSANSVV